MQTSAATGQIKPIFSEAELLGLVRLVARRMRLQDTLRLAPRALAMALAGLLLGQLAEPRAGAAALVVFTAIGVAGGLATLVLQARRIPGTMAAAIQIDIRLDLKERVSTAVHLVQAGTGGNLVDKQLADARRHATAVDAGTVYRIAIPRRDLAAVAALGFLLVALAATPFGADLRDVIAQSSAPAAELDQTLPEGAALQRPDAVATASSGEGATELEERQRALEQLRLSSNPEALDQRDALTTLGSELRTSSVSREFGRELENGDLTAAAEALRELASDLPNMNAGQRQELQRDLELAAATTANDPILGPEFQRAADALASSQLPETSQSLESAADSVERLAPVLAAEDKLQQSIAALEREISELAGGANPPSSSTGPDGQPVSSPTTSSGAGQGDASVPGLESNARGRESGELELLGSSERLDSAGNLEIVEIEADQSAAVEDFAPPDVQLSGDPEPSLEPSAGQYGYVRSRPDVDTRIPVDAGGIVADYFSARQ